MVWTERVEPKGRVLRLVTAVHRSVYRRSGGRLLTRGRGKPVLLLTTTGRRSGRSRTVPLPYLPDGDALVVVASNSGSDRHPAWYHNLVADPAVTLQVGRRHLAARAEVVAGGERADLWARLVAGAPWYDTYQAGTSREIPLVRLVEA
ncbi:MAG: nitroreductase family deazaflavin-dependent oxidoreductase [Acidimicrobiia bacterium]|nr:nitroreductase family deazaflavin-dependent oxidoreductase [Acidimicrobiia bacterium]